MPCGRHPHLALVLVLILRRWEQCQLHLQIAFRLPPAAQVIFGPFAGHRITVAPSKRT